jgi:hypothetical protein
MAMSAEHGADRDEVRAAVAARYAGLARAAQAGQQVINYDPGEFAAGGFGQGVYPDVAGLPEGAVRASLGCGNPVVVAGLRAGETVLDLGCGGVSTCCCPPGGSARPGRLTAWT